jgi:hypothetical protein
MKRALVISGLLLTCLAAGVARAGYKSPQVTVVNLTSRLANGQLGYARNSPDTTQYIGCSRTVTASGGGILECSAMSAASVYGSCWVSDPVQVANLSPAIASMTDGSRIMFWWDASGRCTQILVQNNSIYEPQL